MFKSFESCVSTSFSVHTWDNIPADVVTITQNTPQDRTFQTRATKLSGAHLLSLSRLLALEIYFHTPHTLSPQHRAQAREAQQVLGNHTWPKTAHLSENQSHFLAHIKFILSQIDVITWCCLSRIRAQSLTQGSF